LKKSKNNKVLLIGLDGADPDFIEKHKDRLPIIKSFMDNGTFGSLKSTIPPLTAPAWTSMMSGMNPAKTGVLTFIKEGETGKDKVVNSSSVVVPRIWYVLNQNGKVCGVIGVPLTYPPEALNGFMVSDFLTPSGSENFTFPDSLRKEIDTNFRPYLNFDIHSEGAKSFLQKIYNFSESRFKVIQHFIKNKNWDFFTFVVSETDWIQHFFWKHPEHLQYKKGQEIILKYFQYIDNFIGQILSILGDDIHIFIVSDHGFGKCISGIVYVNSWLSQEGYLSAKDNGLFNIRNLIGQNLRNLFASVPFSQKLKDIIPQKVKAKALSVTKLNRGQINWPETKAYFIRGEYNTGFIRMGEEVLNGDIKNLCKEIIEELSNLEDPRNGNKIFKEVYYKGDIYSGSLDNIPNIILVFNEPYTGEEVVGKEVIKYISEEGRPDGTHRVEGIFLAKGPEIKRNFRLDVDIKDIAPTVYHLMAVCLPNEIDGQVLKKIFKPGSKTILNEVRYSSYLKAQKKSYALDEKEEESIKERLRSLSYLD